MQKSTVQQAAREAAGHSRLLFHRPISNSEFEKNIGST
jgi:hypothetical protein